MKANDWIWHGSAAHLCVGNMCRFHLATEVGKYLVSTVGEYFPPDNKSGNPEPLGVGKNTIYETMIFEWLSRCSCGCGLPTHEGSEIESQRYATPLEARLGHLEWCRIYARKRK